MASTPLLSSPATTSAAAAAHHCHHRPSFPVSPSRPPFRSPGGHRRALTSLRVSSSPPANAPKKKPQQKQGETVFFDGGAHYGDLVANLLLGFTLLWLPLTIAAVSRALFLRYRFTDLRVTVVSGLTGQDRSDFAYDAIKDVQVVPRFVGEWGDIVITLKDGTKVDLRSVPKFRQIAKYCLSMARNNPNQPPAETAPKGF